ncbi:hypothetical protein, partial [Chryseobacterium sp.]|uniref:hypothetical protein n=1 Tax=Chryseobacterium sp. TaxID=1871047 RepID=UPI002FCC9DFC
MKLTKNTIGILKGYVFPTNNGMDNRREVSTVQSTLMGYGYMMDEQLFDELSKSDLSFIVKFHDEVVKFIKVSLGGDKNYQPFYKNFPNDVMSMSDTEKLINSFLHYLSNGNYVPIAEDMDRTVRFE